ncbi:MAG: TIM-barrel domain-containing protein [Anaerolineae bacterium]
MATSELYERIRFRGQPIAHADAVVIRGDVRFTVLTPRLVRLEWSEVGEFEDRSTYAFPTRYRETPPWFEVQDQDGDLILETDALAIRYALDSGKFTAENLQIAFAWDGEESSWHPGMDNPENLRGTRRTLDRCAGDASLNEGLLSAAGWALFDDSNNVVFDDDGWVAARPDHALQDWYFFAYGRDYLTALQAYSNFGGKIPLIPRFVLGGWWSRYWAYGEQDFRDLISEFESHGVPLDVLVIDMDWHTPHAWTGYTWNRDLFPDPPAFLKWIHDKGLRVTLNLHPAEGVQSFEEVYREFAQAMGLDPDTEEPAPFRIADKDFVEHYFRMLHHPMEEEGVDFWWMDWQQGEISEVKGLDPLPWINHLHFSDIRRHGTRPMLYSRWGGLGNHRYYVGFSGDTYVTWNALQFQPYMTATAANVLYAWWSHDIGGHMGGATEPELYARWVQFGALSPVLRLHATKDPRAERRPWAFPEPVYEAAKAAFVWRYHLIPYLYTMARVTSDTSVALCRPMYYESPQDESAYAARYQYYLGTEMIAAPIVFPADPKTGMAAIDVWVPPGTWFAYDTLETVRGPRWLRMVGDLNRIPMLVREGAIVPLAPVPEPEPGMLASGTTKALPDDKLVLEFFPGRGAFDVYFDDGLTEAYREGEFEWLPVRSWQVNEGRSWIVSVGPTTSSCEALPDRRAYELRFRGCRQPAMVLVNGEPAADWSYNAEASTATVRLPLLPKTQDLTVTLTSNEGIAALGSGRDARIVAKDVRRLLGEACPEDATDIDAVIACDGPGVQDAVARLGGPSFHGVESVTLDDAPQRLGRLVISPPADGTPVDVAIDYTVERGPERKTYHQSRQGVTAPWIAETPFAFDGEVAPLRWRADLRLTWDGKTLSGGYESKPLFPGIYRYRVAFHDRAESQLSLDDVIGTEEDSQLDAETVVQDPAEMHNLNEPFVIRFWERYAERMQASEKLAAYLLSTVVSAEARDVVLELTASDPVALYLNNEEVAILPREEVPEDVPVQFRPPVRTAVLRLEEGENTLVVATESPEEPRGRWFFGGKFLTPEGEDIVDLTYK